MTVFWFQIGFGLFVVITLIALGIKVSKGKKKSVNDEKALKTIIDELEKDYFDNFELESIVSLSKPDITSVIVNVNHLKIAIEIDNNSGKIVNKEKIYR